MFALNRFQTKRPEKYYWPVTTNEITSTKCKKPNYFQFLISTGSYKSTKHISLHVEI